MTTARSRSSRGLGAETQNSKGGIQRYDKGVDTPGGKPLRLALWATGANKRQCDAQLRQLRTYARRRDWKVSSVYSDVNGSADGLAALLRDFHQGQFQNVLVGHLSDLPLTSLSIAARLLSLADYGAVSVCDTQGDTGLASRLGRNVCLCGIWVGAEIMEQRLESLAGTRTVSAALQAVTRRKVRRPRADPSPRLAIPGNSEPPTGTRSRRSSTVGDGSDVARKQRRHLPSGRRAAP